MRFLYDSLDREWVREPQGNVEFDAAVKKHRFLRHQCHVLPECLGRYMCCTASTDTNGA